MAGSYQHINNNGWSQIENMGDAYECVEELLYIVYANVTQDDLERTLEVFRQYKRKERDPEHDVNNPNEGFWDEGMAYLETQDRMGR